MSCGICEVIASHLGQVYEDENIYAFLSPTAAAIGHIIVTTKRHYPILEEVPDIEVKNLFSIANKLSMILFENLNIKGTNLIINNGVSAGQDEAHIIIHIIPRNEDDGLDFNWEPKKLSEEELSTIELQYKQFTDNVVVETPQEAPPQQPIQNNQPKEDEPQRKPQKRSEDNYLIKQLRRIP